MSGLSWYVRWYGLRVEEKRLKNKFTHGTDKMRHAALMQKMTSSMAASIASSAMCPYYVKRFLLTWEIHLVLSPSFSSEQNEKHTTRRPPVHSCDWLNSFFSIATQSNSNGVKVIPVACSLHSHFRSNCTITPSSPMLIPLNSQTELIPSCIKLFWAGSWITNSFLLSTSSQRRLWRTGGCQ